MNFSNFFLIAVFAFLLISVHETSANPGFGSWVKGKAQKVKSKLRSVKDKVRQKMGKAPVGAPAAGNPMMSPPSYGDMSYSGESATSAYGQAGASAGSYGAAF
jgi:hypothetical protein